MRKIFLSMFLILMITLTFSASVLASNNSSYMDSLLGNMGADTSDKENNKESTSTNTSTNKNKIPSALIQSVKSSAENVLESLSEPTIISLKFNKKGTKLKVKWTTNFIDNNSLENIYFTVSIKNQNYKTIIKKTKKGSSLKMNVNKLAAGTSYIVHFGYGYNKNGADCTITATETLYTLPTVNISGYQTSVMLSKSLASSIIWNNNANGYTIDYHKIEVNGYNKSTGKLVSSKKKAKFTGNFKKVTSFEGYQYNSETPSYSESGYIYHFNNKKENLVYTVTITPHYKSSANKGCSSSAGFGKSTTFMFYPCLNYTYKNNRYESVVDPNTGDCIVQFSWKKTPTATKYDIYLSYDPYLDVYDTLITSTTNNNVWLKEEYVDAHLFIIPRAYSRKHFDLPDLTNAPYNLKSFK